MGITPERLANKKKLERLQYKIHENLLSEYCKTKNEQDIKLIASLEDSLKRIRHQHSELLQSDRGRR